MDAIAETLDLLDQDTAALMEDDPEAQVNYLHMVIRNLKRKLEVKNIRILELQGALEPFAALDQGHTIALNKVTPDMVETAKNALKGASK